MKKIILNNNSEYFNMSKMSELKNNINLVEVLHQLKRLNEEGLMVDGMDLARRVLKLQQAIIVTLEEITENREAPPMLDDEKAARIGTFLDKLKEAADIAQENWKYEVEFRQFCQECSDEEGGEEGDEELGESSREAYKAPPKPPKGSGWLCIKFRLNPSLSLKEKLTRNGFTVDEKSAHGWSGDWLAEMAEEIVLERGEIDLPNRKGRFDRFR